MATALRWAARLVGAALLGTTAGIHAYLWHSEGYRHIPTIGNLFLLTVVSASVLAILLVVVPPRFDRLVTLLALAGAGLELGVVVALAITVNHAGGLFNFQEFSTAPLFWPSVAVEIAGTVVLGLLFLDGAVGLMRSRGHGRVLVSHA